MLTRLDQVDSEEVMDTPWYDYGRFLVTLVTIMNANFDKLESSYSDLSARIAVLEKGVSS